MEGRLDVELAVLDVDVVRGCGRLLEFAVAGVVLAWILWCVVDEKVDEPETTECNFVRPNIRV